MRALTMILAVSPAWAGNPDWLLTAEDFNPYPGYTGALEVTGVNVQVYGFASGNSFNWLLDGVDPLCDSFADTPEGGSGNANGCGVHVHWGTTCSDGPAIGGHYYDSSTITQDPWTNVSYSKKACGLTCYYGAKSPMVTGFDGFADLVGRAVIIHDYYGARVACAILAPPAPKAPPPAPPAAPPRRLLKKLLTTTAATTTAALATAAAVSVVAPGFANLTVAAVSEIASQIADKLAELRPETAPPAPSFSHPSSAPVA